MGIYIVYKPTPHSILCFCDQTNIYEGSPNTAEQAAISYAMEEQCHQHSGAQCFDIKKFSGFVNGCVASNDWVVSE